MANLSTPLTRAFPKLVSEGYEIICPPSDAYNCIAYAAGDTSQIWDDDQPNYWPPGVERSPTIDGLVAVFRRLGFKRCRSNRLEAGYQKVALYSQQGNWTHAALQMPNGLWRSKMGAGELIEHQSPLSISGPEYGNPYTYMRKRR